MQRTNHRADRAGNRQLVLVIDYGATYFTNGRRQAAIPGNQQIVDLFSGPYHTRTGWPLAPPFRSLVESSERQQVAPPMLYRVMRVTATCGRLALRLN
jgi:hypothetical protein